MSKRFLTMLLAAVMMTALFLPAATADDYSLIGGGTYYISTPTGQPLNVRDYPGGEVVGSVAYGAKIEALYNENGWALINFEDAEAKVGFVSSRYISKKDPGPFDPEAAKELIASIGQETMDPLEEINAEFEGSTLVESYTIRTRPTRSSGWVDLRWAPTQGSAIVATYRAGKELKVIRETPNWYQGEDTELGNVGFIKKAFTDQ